MVVGAPAVSALARGGGVEEFAELIFGAQGEFLPLRKNVGVTVTPRDLPSVTSFPIRSLAA